MCESATVTTGVTSNTPISFNGVVLNNTRDMGYFLIIGSLIGSTSSGTIWIARVFASSPAVTKIVEYNTLSANLDLFFSGTGNLCIKSSQSTTPYHYAVVTI